MDRTVYQSCEYDSREYYSLETLEKLAEFYHIPAENLMDEYHIFLYHEPGIQIKQFRKRHGYTQEQFANILNVWKNTVRAWEKGYKRISREHFDQFMKLKKNT